MKELNKMFKPDSVAVIGASNTPGKVGYIIIDNIISGGYKGKVYPINPKSGEIQGLKAYENIKLSKLIEAKDFIIPLKVKMFLKRWT